MAISKYEEARDKLTFREQSESDDDSEDFEEDEDEEDSDLSEEIK